MVLFLHLAMVKFLPLAPQQAIQQFIFNLQQMLLVMDHYAVLAKVYITSMDILLV